MSLSLVQGLIQPSSDMRTIFHIPGNACNHVLIHYVGNYVVATEYVMVILK